MKIKEDFSLSWMVDTWKVGDTSILHTIEYLGIKPCREASHSGKKLTSIPWKIL